MPRKIQRVALFFAIYKDQFKASHHMIVYRHTKKELADELKEKGFVLKFIFNQKDIDMVEKDEFYTNNVSEKDIEYLKAHLDEYLSKEKDERLSDE